MRMAFRYANCMDLQGLSAESGNLRRCGKEAPAQQFTFRQRGENYEGRNPSEVLSGYRYMQLREHIRDRLDKAGDSR